MTPAEERTLLELCAKAMGIELADKPFMHCKGSGALLADGTLWSPLHDSGQCFEMAVALRVEIVQLPRYVKAYHRGNRFGEIVDFESQRLAATRLAVCRAVAASVKGTT